MRRKPKKTQTRIRPPAKPSAPISESQLHRIALIILFLLPLVYYLRFLTGSQMLFGTDFLGTPSFASREFMASYIRMHGNIALWMPYILSGQPTVAAFYGDLFYPTQLLRLFLPVHVVWAWTFFLQVFLAGLGTYLFLKELKLKVVPAALGGIAYMFAGSLLTLAYAGHDGRLIGTSLMPLALFFLHRGIIRRQFLHFLLCGLMVALQLLSGHLQKVYYTGLILLAYFLFQWIRTIRQERSAGIAIRLAVYFAIGMAFAFALSAIQYLPVYGNMPFAARGQERGYAYATSWSMPIIETLDLITPRFSGGLQHYWSKNPFKLHSEYLGILPLLFALLAIVRCWKNRHVKFFSIAFVVTLLMAWGGNTPFYRLPYHLLPGISKIRGPGMIFFLASFSIAVLLGIGLNHILDEMKEKKKEGRLRGVLIAGLIPIVLLLLFVVAKGPIISLLKSATNQTPQKMAALNANYPGIVTGLLLASLFSVIGLALLYLVTRRRLSTIAFGAIAAVVMTLDVGVSLNLWNESKGYVRGVTPPAEYFAPDEVVNFLKSDTSLYRVLPMNYERSENGILMLHGIQSTGGQMPNPLQSYQDFIGAGSSVMFQTGNLANPNFMNLLNIKYVISLTLPEDASQYDEQSRRVIQQLRTYFARSDFEPAFIGRKYTVYHNKTALPRAFVVPNYQIAGTKEEIISQLMRSDFDPAGTALLYESPGLRPTHDSAVGTARVTEYDANRITVQAEMTGSGLLILSENYHPAWKAHVDGQPIPILQTFHTLRAVPLGPGAHEVVFRHQSRYYRLGVLISMVAVLFLASISVVSVLRRRRRKRIIQTPGA